MRSPHQQNDRLIRSIRTQRLTLNIKQKETLQRVFRSHLAPDFTLPQYRRLLLNGVPAEFRSYIWTHLLPNQHRISPLTYAQLRQQLSQHRLPLHSSPMGTQKTTPQDNPENAQEPSKLLRWLGVIEQDIPRTFPELRVFHCDEEQREKLCNILGCFAIFRSDVGYIQGLSLLAALFLQELVNEYRAFTAFTTLVTTTVLLDFYTFNEGPNTRLCMGVLQTVRRKSERLGEVLSQVDLKMVTMEWVMTLFTRAFQLDSVPYIWDILIAHRLSSRILQHLCAALVCLKQQEILSCDTLGIPKLLRGVRLSIREEEEVLQVLREVELEEE